MVSPPLDSPPSRALWATMAGDMLEADRHLVALLAKAMRQPVQQMRGGQVAHHAAAFAADLVHIPIQQQQDVVDR